VESGPGLAKLYRDLPVKRSSNAAMVSPRIQ